MWNANLDQTKAFKIPHPLCLGKTLEFIGKTYRHYHSSMRIFEKMMTALVTDENLMKFRAIMQIIIFLNIHNEIIISSFESLTIKAFRSNKTPFQMEGSGRILFEILRFLKKFYWKINIEYIFFQVHEVRLTLLFKRKK